jgi:hypothetical protein
MNCLASLAGDNNEAFCFPIAVNRLEVYVRAIEFEAIAHQNMICILDSVPDEITVRVLVLVNDPLLGDLKALLSSLTEGLEEEDLLRSPDLGWESERGKNSSQ